MFYVFIYLFKEMGSHYVAEAGLQLLGSSNVSSLAFESTEIACVNHHSSSLFFAIELFDLLVYLDIYPFYHVGFANIFSHVLGCLFI